MSANVEITDTFDQWRTKSNEWLSMTTTDGSDNFVKLNNTTNSTSNTTGSIISAGGIGIAKSAVIGGQLTVFGDTDIAGTTNLDAVDIDGAVQIDNTVAVGTNGNGQDVNFFGATAGSHWTWDASADKVIQVGSTQLTGAVTVGVDGTGHDVKLFGAAAGAFMEWDASADELEIRGGAATPGKLLLSTAEATVVDGNKLGQIDFQAPAETGTDALVVGASIVAEADATFSASVNSTDLVFLTADSGAATEKLRIDSTGQVTFADGAIDVNIASHDGTNGLSLGGTVVTSTAAELNRLDGIESTAVGLTDSQTMTNKTLTSPVLNTGVSGTAVLDEDNMTSNSETQLATQQSIKAFTEATSTAMAIALG